MKILINDFEHTEETYTKIFRQYGYEQNELIFLHGFQETKDFMVQQLESNKLHIDLIITNDSQVDGCGDILKASQLRFLKNTMVSSFSKKNFCISSIPMILYSTNDTKIETLFGYDAIVKKNEEGNHDYFKNTCESLIRKWRQDVIDDLETLHIKLPELKNFSLSKHFKEYRSTVLKRPEFYFTHLTKAVSLEFIKCPAPLLYDWTQFKNEDIERPYDLFNHTLKHHLKYGSKINERTVWHELLATNSRLMLKDIYKGYLHEKKLEEKGNDEGQICDFILTNDYPDYLKTTFLEVKREDKKYYVRKKTKRPQFSSGFYSDVRQVCDYRRYNLNPFYKQERTNKIGYETNNFEYVLVAGRKEEKEEMQELFERDLKEHYHEIKVLSFEEFGENYNNYIDKFSRLRVN